jgi:hypothetical protein
MRGGGLVWGASLYGARGAGGVEERGGPGLRKAAAAAAGFAPAGDPGGAFLQQAVEAFALLHRGAGARAKASARGGAAAAAAGAAVGGAEGGTCAGEACDAAAVPGGRPGKPGRGARKKQQAVSDFE